MLNLGGPSSTKKDEMGSQTGTNSPAYEQNPLRLVHFFTVTVHPHSCLLLLFMDVPMLHHCMLDVTRRLGTKGSDVREQVAVHSGDQDQVPGGAEVVR